MDEMSVLFRNTVSKANDLVGNGMRDRYASLLDENDEEPYAATAESGLPMIFNYDAWPENDLD